jgi:hypothetical protein
MNADEGLGFAIFLSDMTTESSGPPGGLGGYIDGRGNRTAFQLNRLAQNTLHKNDRYVTPALL